MRNVPPTWPVEREYKDIESQNLWSKYRTLYPNDPAKHALCHKILQRKARDNARTPVQWTGNAANAGFCAEGTTPWMRVNDDYGDVNAEASRNGGSEAETDGGTALSVWRFWERGMKDRKEHKDAFVYGDYEELDHENEAVFAYVRTAAPTATEAKQEQTAEEKGEKWLVVLNWTGKQVEWNVPEGHEIAMWVASTYTKGKPEKGEKEVKLEAWEGILGLCK